MLIEFVSEDLSLVLRPSERVWERDYEDLYLEENGACLITVVPYSTC